MLKTAGIIIIGDEILSGRVQDSNSIFMARQLRTYGIDLRRITTIPDTIDEIADEIRNSFDRFDYLFTSGGIGPTHDDVTIEGISKAFNIKPVINEQLRNCLKDICKDTPERLKMPEFLKMAMVPQGAELITDKSLRFPLIRFKNIFIFPGIPEYLRKKFFVVEKIFDKLTILLKKVYINQYESEIASILNEIVNTYKDVKIGSYPIIDNPDYCVILTFESLNLKSLNAAIKSLENKLPEEIIVKIED